MKSLISLRNLWLAVAVLCIAGCPMVLGADIRVAQGSRLVTQQDSEKSDSATAGVTAAPAQAQGEAKKAEGEDEKEDQETALRHSASVRMIAKLLHVSVDAAYWICLVLNFAVLAGMIVFFMKSNLPKMFRARTDDIRKGIEDASKASQEANEHLAGIEARLAKLDSEIAQMRVQAEAAGAQEEERVRAAAEEEKRSILAAAEQEIASAVNSVRRQLKQDASDLAIAIAEKKISINAATDRELVSEFAGRLGKDGRN